MSDLNLDVTLNLWQRIKLAASIVLNPRTTTLKVSRFIIQAHEGYKK